MSQQIDELMDFNPSDLTVFHPETNGGNTYDVNIYKTNPAKSVSEDGHYRSQIRILYNPFNVKNGSIVPRAQYAMKDAQGFFMVNSSLAIGDKKCPIFSAWKRLWFSGDETKKEWARKMFDKSESQWVLVQILEDANQPELVGQFKAMKLPRAIFDKLNAKMNPSPESKKQPVPLMDYLFGSVLEMDVQPGPDDPTNPGRKQREISYSLCDFGTDATPIIKVDGTPLFTDEELEVIEAYYAQRLAIGKAKTESARKKAEAEIESLKPRVKELYGKAKDYLEANALNLEDEVGYKEWDPATTARVVNWIQAVENLQDPATTVAPVVAVEEPEVVAVADPEADDDLPF